MNFEGCWKVVRDFWVHGLRGAALLLGAVFLLAPGESRASEAFEGVISPFLEEHCIRCHGEEKQKGDIRLDSLHWDFSSGENAVSWQDVSDMLIIGDMPPEDEERPPSAMVSQVIEAIDVELRAAAKAVGEGSRIAIRRLSHSALDNTVRDLLGTHLLISEFLPADAELDGFENLALTLDANPELVLKLQHNAQAIANDVIQSGQDIRERRLYSVEDLGHSKNVEKRNGFAVTASGRDRNQTLWPIGFVAPQDGLYRLRVTSFAGDNRWDLDARGVDYEYVKESYRTEMPKKEKRPNDQLRLAAIVALEAAEVKPKDSGTLPGRRVGYFYSGPEVEEDTIEVRLKEGENIMVQYASAANLQSPPYAKVGDETMLVADLLHVKGIEIEGPLLDAWPTETHRRLLDGKDGQLEERIGAFLFEAFRRPVPKSTLRGFVRLYEMGRGQGLSREDSMRNVVEGVLCSPRFLFNHDSGGMNDVWALASRLSYFLWNSMPDEELRKLAANGKLLRPKVLRKQAIRMLADEKSHRFVEDFTGQWLGLKDIHLMRPDPKLYKEYDPLLEGLIRMESEMYFAKALSDNLPVTVFLDSDFVVINERLAQLYGLEDVKGNQFRKVALPLGSERGGVLGQASILKLTSNGTRTSPVVRGVWVLENLLGDPPSPPPADVEPIEPDVRGSTTMREMLEKHRDIDTCKGCHQKIDPWGFGLEHFDAIGIYRKDYPNGQPVSAHGSVSNGSFNGAGEMKQVLMERSDQFSRALSEKLFIYALGHPLTFGERLVADDIAEANLHGKKGFRDLILEICVSPLFRGELNHSSPEAAQTVALSGE